MQFLNIPFRKTITVDLKHEIKNFINKNYSTKPPDIEEDCEQIQALRECSQAGTQETLNYLAGIHQLLTKTELLSTNFVWYTSLGPSRLACQSQGLWFEYANVLFNLGIGYLNHAQNLANHANKSCYIELNKAAGVFSHLSTKILPHLSTTPTDMSTSNLNLLSQLCSSFSLKLSSSTAQDYFSAYLALLELLKQDCLVECIGKNCAIEIRKESDNALVCALKLLLEYYMHSRKHEDHLIAKSIMDKILSMETDYKIEQLMLTPVSRRSKTVFADLPTTDFDFSSFFSTKMPALPSTPFAPIAKSQLFASLLPSSVAEGPITIKMNLLEHIYTTVFGVFRNMDDQTNQVLVNNYLPFGIELVQQSTQIPESLTTLQTNLTNSGFNYSEMVGYLTEIGHTDALDQLTSIEHLLTILSSSPQTIDFLSITTKSKNLKPKSKPLMLTMCEEVMNKVINHSHTRKQLADKIWTWVTKIDYERILLDLDPQNRANLCQITQEIVNSTAQNSTSITELTSAHATDLKSVKMLAIKFQKFRQSANINEAKLQKCQALYTAGIMALKMQSMKRNNEMLDSLATEIQVFINRKQRVSDPPINNLKSTSWVPGSKIVFSD